MPGAARWLRQAIGSRGAARCGVARRGCAAGRGPAGAETAAPAAHAGRLIRIERHQRSRLIRRQFLADFACGFRQIGSAFRASSHSDFSTCFVLPGYHTTRSRCKSCAAHHIPSCAQTSKLALSGLFVGLECCERAPPLVLADNSDSIMGLVELPVRRTFSRRTPHFIHHFTLFLKAYEGELTHGS